MKILYVTCAENGFYGLKQLLRRGQRIAAVVTISPEVALKAQVSGYVDLGDWVSNNGLQLVTLDTYTLKPEHVDNIQADVLVVNGWNRLISNDVLEKFSYGGLGIHAGHPPIGLGRAPLVWNMLLGHRELEVYVFRLTPEADNGFILSKRQVEITPWDTVRTLYEKVMLAGADLFEIALELLASGGEGEPQALEFAKHYTKRTPNDGLIDFTQNEMEIFNFVRAQVPPYPGAFTYLKDVRWKVYEAVPFDLFAFSDKPRVPGRIISALPSGLIVQTGGSTICIRSAENDFGERWPSSLEKMESLIGYCFGAGVGEDNN